MPKKNKIKYVVIGVCVILAGIFYFMGRKEKNTVTTYADNFNTIESRENVLNDEIQQETTTEVFVCVYVCGEVRQPDVYYITKGERVADAIKAAGGATENAYLQALNLAEIVYDGQRLYVPSYEESSGAELFSDIQGDSGSQGLVNINTADAGTLMSLPGIGESKAQSIISYREENGAYKDIQDIMNVPGIKEAAFSKIKDFITV